MLKYELFPFIHRLHCTKLFHYWFICNYTSCFILFVHWSLWKGNSAVTLGLPKCTLVVMTYEQWWFVKIYYYCFSRVDKWHWSSEGIHLLAFEFDLIIGDWSVLSPFHTIFCLEVGKTKLQSGFLDTSSKNWSCYRLLLSWQIIKCKGKAPDYFTMSPNPTVLDCPAFSTPINNAFPLYFLFPILISKTILPCKRWRLQ